MSSAVENSLKPNGKYLQEAEAFLTRGDYAEASQKLWGAAAEIVKAVSARPGMELGTHARLWEYVSRLDRERPKWNLLRDFSYAGNLHQNFYVDWLTGEYVEKGVLIVKDFVAKQVSGLSFGARLGATGSFSQRGLAARYCVRMMAQAAGAISTNTSVPRSSS